MSIYTKTGDNGETSLLGGKRVSKADLRVEAYGNIDELNSLIGIILSIIQKSKLKSPVRLASGSVAGRQNYKFKVKNELIKVQEDLLGIGSLLADGNSKRLNLSKGSTLIKKRVSEFEKLIDEIDKKLPDLKNFILPGGGETGSTIHLARAVSRRAERRLVELSKKEIVDKSVLIYFNRLSDLLFTMARFTNHQENKKEIIWTKEKCR